MAKVRLVDVETFKRDAAARIGASPDEDQHGEELALWKYMLPEIKATNEERTLEFVISDGGVDRDGDTIAIKGWDLKAFRKNPVVLFAHNSYAPPIGKASNIKIEDDKLVARAEFLNPDFADHEHVRFADMIFRMLEQKILRATSVGFLPTKFNFVDDDAERAMGIDFLKQELLEFSIVPVPANPRALLRNDMLYLARAHEVGIDTDPMRLWAERVLDDSASAGLDRGFVERAWKAATERTTYIEMADPEPADKDVEPVVTDPADDPAVPETLITRHNVSLEKLITGQTDHHNHYYVEGESSTFEGGFDGHTHVVPTSGFWTGDTNEHIHELPSRVADLGPGVGARSQDPDVIRLPADGMLTEEQIDKIAERVISELALNELDPDPIAPLTAEELLSPIRDLGGLEKLVEEHPETVEIVDGGMFIDAEKVTDAHLHWQADELEADLKAQAEPEDDLFEIEEKDDEPEDELFEIDEGDISRAVESLVRDKVRAAVEARLG